jgi:hypothetical protein
MEKKIKTIPKKIPKRYFQVYDPIFGRRIHILLNYTPEEYAKWLAKKKIKDIFNKEFDDFMGFSSVLTLEDQPKEFIIYIKSFDWMIKDQGTLIHEIVHTIIKIWGGNNIPYNEHTQEFLAHSISGMYEMIARKLLVIVKK